VQKILPVFIREGSTTRKG